MRTRRTPSPAPSTASTVSRMLYSRMCSSRSGKGAPRGRWGTGSWKLSPVARVSILAARAILGVVSKRRAPGRADLGEHPLGREGKVLEHFGQHDIILRRRFEGRRRAADVVLPDLDARGRREAGERGIAFRRDDSVTTPTQEDGQESETAANVRSGARGAGQKGGENIEARTCIIECLQHLVRRADVVGRGRHLGSDLLQDGFERAIDRGVPNGVEGIESHVPADIASI